MNLSPDWIVMLGNAGYDAIHCSDIGAFDAPDDLNLGWARTEDRIVLTNDVDFGTLLATSGTSKPIAMQNRTGPTLSSRIGPLGMGVLRDREGDLASGTLVTVEDGRVRPRPLTFTA